MDTAIPVIISSLHPADSLQDFPLQISTLLLFGYLHSNFKKLILDQMSSHAVRGVAKEVCVYVVLNFVVETPQEASETVLLHLCTNLTF